MEIEFRVEKRIIYAESTFGGIFYENTYTNTKNIGANKRTEGRRG